MCPCPTPIELAYEALEEDRAVPIPQAPTNRRKSSTWKTFNLKRQLSKVDMKLKNTFSGTENLKQKRNSVFYSEAPSTQDLDGLEEDKSSPESDDNTVIDNQSVIDLSVSPNRIENRKDSEVIEDEIQFSPDGDGCSPIIVGSLGTQYELSSGNKRVGFATRPDNLDLIDDDGYPVRPPRGLKKKTQIKRDQRLLSVPNIKFQRADIQTFKDLRDKEDTIVSPQPSFAGNLMRRFSKF